MNLDVLQETLVPTFTRVIENNYDPTTAIAYMEPEDMPGEGYLTCIEHMREMLTAFFPDAVIVDAGGIYKSTDRKKSFGWWIQFKL